MYRKLQFCYGPLEVGDCLCRLFEEVRENRLLWQSKEFGRDSLPLEVACRSAALRSAQERQEPTSELLRDFSILNAMQLKQGQNTYTGLVNFQSLTCWLNSAVQLLWHSEFVSAGYTIAKRWKEHRCRDLSPVKNCDNS